MSTGQARGIGLTLVAYYGEKLPAIADFVRKVQAELSRNLPGAFEPYPLAQVHATVIGLEGLRVDDSIVNTFYFKQRHEVRPMNLAVIFQILHDPALLPCTIRVGGYKDGTPYPFTSRGLHPFLRSFSIQGDRAVVVGWPNEGQRYPLALDRLRRAFNEAKVVHKYHTSLDEIDNDFFFVLGRINRSKVSELTIQQAQEKMRAFLANHDSLVFVLDRQHISLVAYVDTKLPPESSRVYGLDEAEKQINEIQNLYRSVVAKS